MAYLGITLSDVEVGGIFFVELNDLLLRVVWIVAVTGHRWHDTRGSVWPPTGLGHGFCVQERRY